MSRTRAVLAGIGVSIGRREVDNHMLAKIMDTNDEWIRERSGIETRYYADHEETSADLGAEAARRAIVDAAVEVEEIDYIVCATMTPDHYFPGCGTLIQQRLGLSARPALDIRQQCAGFAYGLQMVDALIRSGIARTVLLVGSDVHTSLMPYSDATWRVLYGETDERLASEDFEWNSKFRNLLVLFGDAAGAMIFRADPEGGDRGILGSVLYGEGNHKDILFVPGVGSASRPFVHPSMITSGLSVPHMDGGKVFKLAVRHMPKVTREVLDQHGYSIEDLDLLVMHQANLRINDAARKMLRLSPDKVFNNIQKYGNTTSATLPLCFHEARRAGKAPEGSLVAFTALGAGLHYGSVLVRI